MPEKSYRWIYYFIFILVILLRASYLLIIPPANFPDEKFHLERIISETKHLPINRFTANNEYYHPPLYYWFSTLLVRIFGQNNIWLLLRLTSFCLSLIFTYLIWRILRLLNLSAPLLFSNFIFINFLPTLNSELVSINNDVLELLLSTLFIFLILKFNLRKKVNIVNIIYLSIVAALAVLTKSWAFIFLLSFLIVYSGKIGRGRILVFISLFSTIVSLWFLNDYLATGNPFVTTKLLTYSLLGSRSPFSFSFYLPAVWQTVRETFWATFGDTNNIRLSGIFYGWFYILMIFSLYGLIKGNWQEYRSRNYLFLGLSFLFNVMLFLYLNLRLAFQPQGRYFFSSIIFLSLVFNRGLQYFLHGKSKYLLPLFMLSIFIFANLWSINCLSVNFYRQRILPKLFSCIFYR